MYFFDDLKSNIKTRFSKKTQIQIPENDHGNWHENLIVHLATLFKPKVYVELGLYRCELFNRILPIANQLYGVDISVNAGDFMKKSNKAKFFHCDTDKFSKWATENKLVIDMLFIDANHSKESVLNDFKNYFPLVRDNGIILLHDGFPKDQASTDPGFCGDGHIAIKHLTENQEGFEIVTLPLPPGLSIVRKRKQHIPWTIN